MDPGFTLGSSMSNKHRHGKLVGGGHSTILQGLKTFLKRFEGWDEVEHVVLGPVSHRRTGSGDLKFRATRWALAGGSTPNGIKCEAVRGPLTQSIIITSHDPEALKKRLAAAGYVNW